MSKQDAHGLRDFNNPGPPINWDQVNHNILFPADKQGHHWSAEELFTELRYLVSSIEYGWDDDISGIVDKFMTSFELLPREDQDD